MAKVGASAASSEPPANKSMLAMNKALVGILLIRNAVAGIIIPMAKEKPLVSHWPALAVTPKVLMISGNAVVSAVCSKDEIRVPVNNTAKIKFRFLEPV